MRFVPGITALLVVLLCAPHLAVAALTWETLEARLDHEAASGFSGSVLVVRNGKVVLDRGYGLANREQGIPCRPDTIFAIGSTPIDFTKAGILLLAERGRLALSDPITKYFDRVPPDKKAMTIDHLMHGRSGLQNFHDLPTDGNPDHSWIDREEAVRRILAQELLFAPGKGSRHSHSAWGLLAAIIEIAGGQPYPEFTREHLLKPAGMIDTGFFGESYPEARMAVGYGDDKSGRINAPPYWGRTSWLVMGSGGQTSTTRDMQRWHDSLRSGKILSPASLDLYFERPGGIFAGGDQFGFEMMYTRGPGSMMVMLSNSGGAESRRAVQSLGRDLAGLVSSEHSPKYTLGVELAVEDDGRVSIQRVLPGSAAERDGLRAGDLLVSAGGIPLTPEPLSVLEPYLASGDPILFVVQRAGSTLSLRVKPNLR